MECLILVEHFESVAIAIENNAFFILFIFVMFGQVLFLLKLFNLSDDLTFNAVKVYESNTINFTFWRDSWGNL